MIHFSRMPLLIISHFKSNPGLKCSKCPFPPSPPPALKFSQNGCLNSPRRRLVSIDFIVGLRLLVVDSFPDGSLIRAIVGLS